MTGLEGFHPDNKENTNSDKNERIDFSKIDLKNSQFNNLAIAINSYKGEKSKGSFPKMGVGVDTKRGRSVEFGVVGPILYVDIKKYSRNIVGKDVLKNLGSSEVENTQITETTDKGNMAKEIINKLADTGNVQLIEAKNRMKFVGIDLDNLSTKIPNQIVEALFSDLFSILDNQAKAERLEEKSKKLAERSEKYLEQSKRLKSIAEQEKNEDRKEDLDDQLDKNLQNIGD